MNLLPWSVASWALCALSAPTAAQDLEPGSVLVYPSVRQTNGRATLVSVTNINAATSVNVRFRYVNMTPTGDPFAPNCATLTRVELLTPNDTFSIPASCHNLPGTNGYLVIDAVHPTNPLLAISHNFLIGSEFVAFGSSAAWSMGAISFPSPFSQGSFTDVDADGELDFDGIEYARCPDTIYIDQFLASAGTNLTLINLTGGTMHTATVSFTIFNDNENVFSAQRQFRCWFDQPLDAISPLFTAAFLASTPHDPSEADADCDGVGDVESGWAIVNGVNATTAMQFISNPALLGAVTGSLAFERGRPLWRTGLNANGDFLGTSQKHPEFP